MKFLSLVFVVGFALASAVPAPSHDLSLKEDDLEYRLALAANDDDDATELKKKLQERMEEILENMKNSFENGKTVTDDMIKKLKDVRGKMKDAKVDMREKAKELLKNIKERAKDYWQKLWEKLTGNDHGGDMHAETFMIADEVLEMEQRAAEHIREDLIELRKEVYENFEMKRMVDLIESIFGKNTPMGTDLINQLEASEDPRQSVLDFIDACLRDTREKRSIKDLYDRIKNYFEDFQIEVKEKFVKVCEFLKENYGKGLEAGKGRAENLKKLAREFIADTKAITTDVAEQAKEFFREYKEDLGVIYDDVHRKIEGILKKN